VLRILFTLLAVRVVTALALLEAVHLAASLRAVMLVRADQAVALVRLVRLVRRVIIKVVARGAVAAQQVLLVAQGLQGQRALRVQQGLLGHIYRVKLMLHILTSEQETEQHHESKIQNC
jgi:class 3 adenylate cyclase